MKKNATHRILMLLITAAITMTGCDEDERVARIATEAAERQAQQNQEMVRLNREVAEGTKRLVEADAVARQEQAAMQHDLQDQQAKVGDQRDQLEVERQQIARQRRTESMLGPILKGCAMAAVCLATIGFCWCLLFGLRHDNADQSLGDLLVEELVSDRPAILPSVPSTIENSASPTDEGDPKRLAKPD